MSVVVVDTGVANLHSVTSALSRLDAEWSVSDNPKTIAAAERIILPGVGSAAAGMRSLREKDLVETLKGYPQPMMGICLGMQMMFEGLGESETEGLGLFDGDIEKLDAKNLPLPHMGWNAIDVQREDALLSGVSDGDYVYFVHSFGAKADNAVASATYGAPFAAVVRDGNRMGCQFHPERSGAVGSRIIENFLSL